MADDKSLAEGLLKANGVTPCGLSEEDRKALQRILQRSRKNVRGMKWTLLIGWGVMLMLYIAAIVWKNHSPGPAKDIITIAGGTAFVAMFWFGVICGISYLIRSWLLNKRETQMQMIELNARLAQMEESLQKIAGKG